MKQVSVIIPTYYRYRYLETLLNQLLHQTTAPLEILVIDQTPFADRPLGFYDKYAGTVIRLLNYDKPSLTAPRNVAARAAKGDVLLFLDDDITMKNDFIASHINVMEEEHVDVVNGATTRTGVLPETYPWDMKNLDPVRLFLVAPNYNWKGMMLGISSCNASIKKDVFLAVGGFDERLPRMVDFEIGYRLFRYGAKIFFSPKPAVHHLRGDGGSRKDPRNYDRLVSALYIHKKHFQGWTTFQFGLKMIFGAYWGPWKIHTPFMPAVGLGRFLRANRIANQLLKLPHEASVS